MEKECFIIKTRMEKSDYRKFLYIATFCKNKITIPMILLISFIGAIIYCQGIMGFHIVAVGVWTIIMFVVSMSVICFRVERRNNKRMATDATGAFDSESILTFYEDRVIMENECMKSKGELTYAQFYFVLESKEYFIFYINANQASLIRKKDIDNCEEFKSFLLKTFAGRYKHI